MNPNEVKLIDFDAETLSEISSICAGRIAWLMDMQEQNPNAENRKNMQERIDRARTFQTQTLYAFSVVQDREKANAN